MSEGIPTLLAIGSPEIRTFPAFDFEQIKPLRAFYKEQYAYEARRKEEISRLYPIPITMIGLTAAGNAALFGIFPSMPITGAVVLFLGTFSILEGVIGADRFSGALNAPYAEAISPRDLERIYRNHLATAWADQSRPSEAIALEKTMAYIDARYRDDAVQNAKANRILANGIRKSLHSLFLAGFLSIVAALCCVYLNGMETKHLPLTSATYNDLSYTK